MKRLLALALVMPLLTSLAVAADPAVNEQGPDHVRLSKLMRVPVKDKNNEDLGTLREIVFDMKNHKVAYAAVSVGGFLGVGDAMHAVAWDALKLRHIEGGELSLMLPSIDRNQIKDHKGFDQNRWPAHADAMFGGSAVGPTDKAANESNEGADKTNTPRQYKGSQLLGLDVRGADDQSIGRLYELVLDASSGQPAYAVIAHGGVLGVGDKLTAVTADEIKLGYDDRAAFFALSVAPDEFKARKTFTSDAFPKHEDIRNYTSADKK